MENEILNFSRIEEDPFAEIPLTIDNTTQSSTTWQPSQASIIMGYTMIVTQIANFFLGIGAVGADILLIYLILRYKRLRKNLNLYILHYSIMNLTHFLITPVSLLLHALIFARITSFIYLRCVVYLTEVTALYMSFIFAFLLALEWTWFCFRPDYAKHPNFLLQNKFYIIFATLFLQLILNIIACVVGIEFPVDLTFISMPFIFISLIVMHYYRRRTVLNAEHLKTEYSLWVFTIAVGVFAPLYLVDLVFRLFPNSFSYEGIMMLFYLESFFSMFSTPSPIFIIYYLMKWNKHFKMAYDITFNKAVRTYGADNLDEGSDNEEIVQEVGDKVQNSANGGDMQEILVP